MNDVFSALRKRIASQRENWSKKLTHGIGVADLPAYREIVGRIKQLDDLERALDEEFTTYMKGAGNDD